MFHKRKLHRGRPVIITTVATGRLHMLSDRGDTRTDAATTSAFDVAASTSTAATGGTGATPATPAPAGEGGRGAGDGGRGAGGHRLGKRRCTHTRLLVPRVGGTAPFLVKESFLSHDVLSNEKNTFFHAHEFSPLVLTIDRLACRHACIEHRAAPSVTRPCARARRRRHRQWPGRARGLVGGGALGDARRGGSAAGAAARVRHFPVQRRGRTSRRGWPWRSSTAHRAPNVPGAVEGTRRVLDLAAPLRRATAPSCCVNPIVTLMCNQIPMKSRREAPWGGDGVI
jgi:hypothetical protein